MAYLSVFELRADEANYGKIKVSNSDGAPIGTEKAYISIESPVGIIKAMDLTAADIDLALADNELLVDIPVDSDGEFIIGIYTILVMEIHPLYGTVNYTYRPDFCPLLGSPSLSFVVNCVCAKATITDGTVYGEGATVVREMKIFPPTIPGQATPSTITTSASSYTVDLTYSNVKYQVNLLVELNSAPVSGVTVLEKISYAEWFTVVCDYDLCGLVDCVNVELASLEAKATRQGGYKNLNTYDFDRFLTISRLMFKHNILVDCQDYEGVQETYEELRALVDCDCGCPPNNQSGPVALSGACGASGPTLSVSATTPITATLVGTTWQLAFSSSYKAVLDALRIYNNVSTNADLTIGKAYDSGSNIETDDYALTVNSWNTVTQAGFAADFVPTSGLVLSAFNYRLVPGEYIECQGQIRMDNALSTGSHVLLDVVLTAGYRPTNNTAWYPISGPDGSAAGVVRLTTTGQIEIYTSINWTSIWSSTGYVSFHFIAPKAPPALV